MFSKVFLAVTAQEMTKYQPEKPAYLALHFSSYRKGLSNIPTDLPKGSIILLDDSTPPENHDSQIVAEQLNSLIAQFSPSAVLLDFQRPYTRELENIATDIVQALPCPVGVTEVYAKKLKCPVFLPPPPINKTLENYLNPWIKQGIYLEIAPDGLEITVTEKGSREIPIPLVSNLPLADKMLHCHYDIKISQDEAIFTLCRQKEDLAALVHKAQTLGVLGCIGLYRELQE